MEKKDSENYEPTATSPIASLTEHHRKVVCVWLQRILELHPDIEYIKHRLRTNRKLVKKTRNPMSACFKLGAKKEGDPPVAFQGIMFIDDPDWYDVLMTWMETEFPEIEKVEIYYRFIETIYHVNQTMRVENISRSTIESLTSDVLETRMKYRILEDPAGCIDRMKRLYLVLLIASLKPETEEEKAGLVESCDNVFHSLLLSKPDFLE